MISKGLPGQLRGNVILSADSCTQFVNRTSSFELNKRIQD